MDDMKINPIHQYAPGEKINPIHHLYEQSEYRSIITKNNIGNIRGNKLYTRVGGYDIFTSLNDTIIVDTSNRNVIIQREEEETLTPADERKYLLLLTSNDDSEEGLSNEWFSVIGRQEAFDLIVLFADNIDIQNSYILAETIRMKDAIPVFSFLKMCIDKELVQNPTGFDYSDYATEIFDDIEEEE